MSDAVERGRVWIANSFSLNMLPDGAASAHLTVRRLDLDEARALARGASSVVGHPDTASLFEQELGCPVPPNRSTLRLAEGDQVLVGQYVGPRLDVGATVRPSGVQIHWMLVELDDTAG